MGIETYDEDRLHTIGTQPLLQSRPCKGPVHLLLEQGLRSDPDSRLWSESDREFCSPRPWDECPRFGWLIVVTNPSNRSSFLARPIHVLPNYGKSSGVVWYSSFSAS